MASTSAPTRDHGTSKPDPTPVPEKPLLGDCCGSRCACCVWDIYYDELETYNKALAAQSSSSAAESGGKVSSESKASATTTSPRCCGLVYSFFWFQVNPWPWLSNMRLPIIYTDE
jgi:hypothetical protein